MALAANTVLKTWGEVMLKSLPARQALALLADDAFAGTAQRKGDTVHFTVDNGTSAIKDVASFAWEDVDTGAFSVAIDKNFCFALTILDVDQVKLVDGFGTKAVMHRAMQLGAKIEQTCVDHVSTMARKVVLGAGDTLKQRILALHAGLRATNCDMAEAVLLCDPTAEASILDVMSTISAADMSNARVNGDMGRFLGFRCVASNFVPAGTMVAGVPSSLKLAVALPAEIEEKRLENKFATGYRAQALWGVGTIGKGGTIATDTLANEATYWFKAPVTGAQTART